MSRRRILFVCMGNICRSPTAEGVMRAKLAAAGLDLEVDSAGTHGYHVGAPPDERSQAHALRRGYATAGTDPGHPAADGPVGMFALGHPEKIVDFAYRSIHDMTVKSKRLIDVFYANPLDYSYYKGCSTGGRQGVMEAQRFAGDFDGIIAGALANRHIHMHTAVAWLTIELSRHQDEAISADKAKLVTDAIMAKCDTLH